MIDSSSNEKSAKDFNWRNLLLWISIALLIRWQIVEPRWIPSGSMLPTLQLQDKVLIEKVTPRINQIISKEIQRESIIVFHPPNSLKQLGYDENSALIKRVIGVPGDQIEVNEGNLLLNGKLMEESWITEPMNYEMDVITVPKGSLWVLGDNRNNSLDSHIWGPLPKENVIGTAIWRYWPLKRFGTIRFPTHEYLEKQARSAIRS